MTIEELLEIEEIKNLRLGYSAYYDSNQPDKLAELYSAMTLFVSSVLNMAVIGLVKRPFGRIIPTGLPIMETRLMFFMRLPTHGSLFPGRIPPMAVGI